VHGIYALASGGWFGSGLGDSLGVEAETSPPGPGTAYGSEC